MPRKQSTQRAIRRFQKNSILPASPAYFFMRIKRFIVWGILVLLLLVPSLSTHTILRADPVLLTWFNLETQLQQVKPDEALFNDQERLDYLRSNFMLALIKEMAYQRLRMSFDSRLQETENRRLALYFAYHYMNYNENKLNLSSKRAHLKFMRWMWDEYHQLRQRWNKDWSQINDHYDLLLTNLAFLSIEDPLVLNEFPSHMADDREKILRYKLAIQQYHRKWQEIRQSFAHKDLPKDIDVQIIDHRNNSQKEVDNKDSILKSMNLEELRSFIKDALLDMGWPHNELVINIDDQCQLFEFTWKENNADLTLCAQYFSMFLFSYEWNQTR